jgi:hypothetical protein
VKPASKELSEGGALPLPPRPHPLNPNPALRRLIIPGEEIDISK